MGGEVGKLVRTRTVLPLRLMKLKTVQLVLNNLLFFLYQNMTWHLCFFPNVHQRTLSSKISVYQNHSVVVTADCTMVQCLCRDVTLCHVTLSDKDYA